MPLSDMLIEDINFLKQLDPDIHSIGLNKQKNALEKVKKRSCVLNFFSWIIHLITCTGVPRNRELDKVTTRVLKEASEPQQITASEKKLLEKATHVLDEVIRKNAGNEQKLKKLFEVIENIKVLQPVQDLIEKKPEVEKVILTKQQPEKDLIENNQAKEEKAVVIENKGDPKPQQPNPIEVPSKPRNLEVEHPVPKQEPQEFLPEVKKELEELQANLPDTKFEDLQLLHSDVRKHLLETPEDLATVKKLLKENVSLASIAEMELPLIQEIFKDGKYWKYRDKKAFIKLCINYKHLGASFIAIANLPKEVREKIIKFYKGVKTLFKYQIPLNKIDKLDIKHLEIILMWA